MNKVVIVGRLTKDPELKFAQGTGTAVATFTVAVNRRFKREGQPDADFIPVVVFGKQAEATANYMAKGKLLSVSGNIQTRNYEAKDGTRRYVTEVIADEVDFLEWSSKPGNKNTETKDTTDDLTPIDEEEIPF
ncbi:single-stranded DNA-binding protein [Clostridium estertheticum]|uniref:single-stranded DNA-binding protein n=1 Tax=Clostridium estertheticum TaxID=238834 RepID=UPI001C6DD969|nr:single-stranded DNA-binding protein [Clostridium estertheticum]MBW9154252.1 single-stranded DNA-binding protein [Clostridium estertheticum]WLC86681.1 single-stranded DNA-binding protein [Clostridium estertheticum]